MILCCRCGQLERPSSSFGSAVLSRSVVENLQPTCSCNNNGLENDCLLAAATVPKRLKQQGIIKKTLMFCKSVFQSLDAHQWVGQVFRKRLLRMVADFLLLVVLILELSRATNSKRKQQKILNFCNPNMDPGKNTKNKETTKKH